MADPQLSVFSTDTYAPPPHHAVKIVKNGTAEADIYEHLLHRIGDPANHTLPCAVIRSEPPIIIMPFVKDATVRVLEFEVLFDCIYQIIQVSVHCPACATPRLTHLITGIGIPPRS